MEERTVLRYNVKTGQFREYPAKFEPIKWSEVTNGDTVFLAGRRRKHSLELVAYGPFRVVDVNRCLLSNDSLNRQFVNMPEELLVKIEENQDAEVCG